METSKRDAQVGTYSCQVSRLIHVRGRINWVLHMYSPGIDIYDSQEEVSACWASYKPLFLCQLFQNGNTTNGLYKNDVIHTIYLFPWGKETPLPNPFLSLSLSLPDTHTHTHTHTHTQVCGSRSSETAEPFIRVPGETITPHQAAEPGQGLGINDGLMTQVEAKLAAGGMVSLTNNPSPLLLTDTAVNHFISVACKTISLVFQ